MSMTDDVLGDAAQEPATHTGPTMRAEDYQIRVPSLGLVLYLGARIATPDGGLDRKAGCLKLTCNLLD
jgi:hypothetical protein